MHGVRKRGENRWYSLPRTFNSFQFEGPDTEAKYGCEFEYEYEEEKYVNLVINVTRYSEEETEARMGTSINIFHSIVSFQTETFNSFTIFTVIGHWTEQYWKPINLAPSFGLSGYFSFWDNIDEFCL